MTDSKKYSPAEMAVNALVDFRCDLHLCGPATNCGYCEKWRNAKEEILKSLRAQIDECAEVVDHVMAPHIPGTEKAISVPGDKIRKLKEKM